MKIKRFLVFLICIALFVGCGGTSSRYSSNSGGGALYQSENKQSFNFIMWEVGRDSFGKQLTSAAQRADALFNQGQYDAAIAMYRNASQASNSPWEQEALMLRESAAFGVKGDFASALKTVSSFFRTRGVSSDRVIGIPAVMLGLLYSYQGNTPQALAWLVKGLKTKGLPGQVEHAGKEGLARVVAGSADDQLRSMQVQWQDEKLLIALIRSELAARERSGDIVPTTSRRADVEMAEGVTRRIAVLLPLSGRYRLLGESTKQGVEIALGQTTAGTAVDVVFADTQGEANSSAAALNTVVASGEISAILGPVLPESSMVMAGLSRQLGVPMLHFSKRPDADFGRGVYRLGITPSSEVSSLLDILIERGVRSAAVVYPDTPAAFVLAKTFQEQASSAGFDIPIGQVFKGSTEEVAALATSIEQANVDAIFFAGNLEDAAKVLSGLSEQYRSKVVPLGSFLWYDPVKLRKLSKIMNGSLFVVSFFDAASSPLVKQFNQSYVDKFGKKPNFLAAQGFDGASLILAAFERQMKTQENFEQAFASIAVFRGLTGAIRTDGSGDLQRTYPVVEFRNGEYVELN
jgi:branched-chain amino acid transport system substrate-binding protein